MCARIAVERLPGDVSLVRIDDGKVNVVDVPLIHQLQEAFATTEAGRGVVLSGRPGVFSAGLDLEVMATASEDAVRELLLSFGRLTLQIWCHPVPTVAACTGHTLAAGAVLALACDYVVAAKGPYSWGLNETQIGAPLPAFARTVAGGSRYADYLMLTGQVIAPARAARAGWVNEIVAPDQTVSRSIRRARRCSAVDTTAYSQTKSSMRTSRANELLKSLEADVEIVIRALRSPQPPHESE
jgi:enoyl-CoA hydratase/carnithine racemase